MKLVKVMAMASLALATTITTPPSRPTLAPRQDNNKDDSGDGDVGLVTKFTADRNKNTFSEEPPTMTFASVPSFQPAIPYTADNPYVNTSNYPEGTVFICVGAILGGLVLLVTAWRLAVSWHLKRQIKESNANEPLMAMYHKRDSPQRKIDHRSLFPSDGPFESNSDMAMDNLSPQGKSMSKSQAASLAAHRASLFFSPTAEVMNAQKNGGLIPDNAPVPSSSANSFMGFSNPGNRSTTYLPSGYYGAQTGPATSLTSQSRTSMRGSMLAPPSVLGGTRANSLRPMSHMDGVGGVRAPSAYLNDLVNEISDSDNDR